MDDPNDQHPGDMRPSPEEIITQVQLLENERIRAATAAAAREARKNLKRHIEESDLEKIAIEREYRAKMRCLDGFTSVIRRHLLTREENRGLRAEVGRVDQFEEVGFNAEGRNQGLEECRVGNAFGSRPMGRDIDEQINGEHPDPEEENAGVTSRNGRVSSPFSHTRRVCFNPYERANDFSKPVKCELSRRNCRLRLDEPSQLSAESVAGVAIWDQLAQDKEGIVETIAKDSKSGDGHALEETLEGTVDE